MEKSDQAPGYLKNFGAFTDDASFEAMFELLPDTTGTEKIILADVMAGVGLVGRNIARKIEERRQQAVHVLYLDISEEMLRDPSYQPQDQRILSKVQELPLMSECADIVTCRCGLNNLPEEAWGPAIHEIMRITKTGGTVLLQDHLPFGEEERNEMNGIEIGIAIWDDRKQMPFMKTIAEVAGMVEAANGKVRRIETVPYTFDLAKRMKAKGRTLKYLENSTVTYPVSTIAIEKMGS